MFHKAERERGIVKGVTDPDEMASLQKSANEAVNKAKQKKKFWEDVKADREHRVQQDGSAQESVGEGATDAKVENEVDTLPTEAQKEAGNYKNDNQGNPLNEDGTLKLEKITSVDDLTDEDFSAPTRNVELPTLPTNVDEAIGANGKPVIIKKNIFEKNKSSHKDLTTADSRKILSDVLYNPNLYGQNKKATRPYNWILVHLADKNEAVIVELNENKDNIEIVNWHYLSDEALKRKKRQAEKEGGQILTLESAAANTHNDLSSVGKGSESSVDLQEVEDKLRELNEEYAETNKVWESPNFKSSKEYWDNERRINAAIDGELNKLGDDDLSEIAKNFGGKVGYSAARILHKRKVDSLMKLSDEDLLQIVSEKGELWEEARDILDGKEAAKSNVQRYNELLEEQGEISGKAKKNYSLNKYTDKSKVRPQLVGVYHKYGYAIATDTHVLVGDRRNYEKANDGKIIDKDGNEIEGNYPDAFAVVPKRIIASDIDAMDLLNFIAGVKEIVKSKKEKLKDKVILLNFGGELWAGNAENLKKFANAAVSLGGKIYFNDNVGTGISTRPIYTESDKGFALMMPIDLTRNSIDKDTYFAYKPAENGVETDSKVGKEKHQFGEGGELRMAQELTDGARKQMQTVARSLGVELVFDDTLKENGRYTTIDKESGRPTIHVAMNASNPLESVFGHEATHRVKSLDNESYSELHDVARLMIGDEEFFDRAKQKKELYAKNGIALSDADAREEVVSDYIGSLIYDKEHIGKVADKLSHPILSKIRDVVSDFLDYFRKNKMIADERLAKGSLRAIDRAFANAANSVQNDAEGTKYSIVEDKSEIDRLNKEELEIGYQNIELKDDLSVGSPMASKLKSKGKGRVSTGNSQFGQWGRSEENPDLVDENGKIDLVKPDGKTVDKVDYNPYFHIRPYLFNKQFKQAWERPRLVFIETQFPISELSSGFKAEKAKLPVGRHNWNGGDLILSRWTKPKSIVPWRDVAPHWIEEFKESGVHFDIVPPALLNTLRENGVEILPPHKGIGKNCFEAYEAFKKGDYNPEYITDEQIDAFNERINEYNSKSEKYAFREGNKKTASGKRGTADSHNPLSESLLPGSSERLSGNALAYSIDDAKIKENTEITLIKAKKILNEGGFKKDINTPAQAISALGKKLGLRKSDSSQSYYGDYYEGDFEVDGKALHLRISTHPANGERMGNANDDDKISIVVRKNGEHISSGKHDGYTEYIYEPKDISPKDAANAIVKSIDKLIRTGEYIDETNKSKRRDYPYIDEEGTIRYSLREGVRDIDEQRKEEQFKIINQTNPAHDDYHTWIRSKEDILTLKEAVDEVLKEDPEYNLSAYPDVSDAMIREALETGEITVYSSYPIENGVFVSPSKMQAKDYAGGGKVYSKVVPINDVAWITPDEGQMASVETKIPVVKYQIIGEKGADALDKAQEATIRIDNLSVAREMENAGKDAKTIRLATGWERGADGKWRYEIMDGKFKKNPNLKEHRDEDSGEIIGYTTKLGELLDNEELFKAYPQLRELRITFQKIGYKEAYFRNNSIHLDLKCLESNEIKQRVLELENSEAFKKWYGVNNNTYSTEEEKDKALDELEETEVYKEWDKLTEHNYSDIIGKKDLSFIESEKGVLLHEIQHAIQKNEAFSSGGNINRIKDVLVVSKKIREKVEDLLSDFGFDEWIKYADGESIKSSYIPGRNFNLGYAFAENVSGITSVERKKLISYLDKANLLLSENNKLFRPELRPFEVYERLAGEVESRNVEARMNMSEQERLETLLADTEDVSRKDQIFLFNNLGESQMGSRVDKRMAEVGEYFERKELSDNERAVVDVFSGKSDNNAVIVKRDGKQHKVVMRQGNENKAGTKHSLFRHYGTNSGVISSEDLLLVPEVIERGEKEVKGNGVSYKLKKDGVSYIVYNEIHKNQEQFCDFYTNRKGSSTHPSNTQLSAQVDSATTNSAANVVKENETASGFDKFSLREDGVSLKSILNDRNIGLTEQITLSKALLAEKNKSDKTLLNEFVRSVTDNLSDVRKAMSAQKYAVLFVSRRFVRVILLIAFEEIFEVAGDSLLECFGGGLAAIGFELDRWVVLHAIKCVAWNHIEGFGGVWCATYA